MICCSLVDDTVREIGEGCGRKDTGERIGYLGMNRVDVVLTKELSPFTMGKYVPLGECSVNIGGSEIDIMVPVKLPSERGWWVVGGAGSSAS